MFIIAFIGIILMIIENEIKFHRNEEITQWNIVISLFTSFSTLLLVWLVFVYHYYDVKLYCVDNSIENWPIIALTPKKVSLIILELIICSIHPIPVTWTYKPSQTNSLKYASPDILLSLPMFLRLYLFARLLVLHSSLVKNASSQSFGYLNRVKINFQFVIKAQMKTSPALCLLIFVLTMFLIMSWSLRACNYQVNSGRMTILDAMYLFVITFTTIGYGDFVPTTYCARVIITLTGFIGLLSTALLIAVIASKLEFIRSEKYLHLFVKQLQLVQEQKYHASNIIKFGLKVWLMKYKLKHNKYDNNNHPSDYIKLYRRLLTSIYRKRQIEQEQRKLTDSYVTLVEVYNKQKSNNSKIDKLTQKFVRLENRIQQIEQHLVEIQSILQNKLNK
ncbi:unnamed protein product [Didymodactylos carnosus]|uniref:Potassium channel domain-containing protein n=1 Tax=Didymodactylos carnosus TaxID=1234261 RepID=A0A8S2PFH6_9BILA|nr:unnamed protein product [Didymodactylos carnosus]CAF4052073.1 unnamed protein product [Didymodactylos carnosus]